MPAVDPMRHTLIRRALPAPAGWPTWDPLLAASFWRRFDRAAPWHLRFGMACAALGLGHLAPRLRGHRRALPHLSDADADAVLAWAAGTPILDALVEVTVLVASLAYFDQPDVQAHTRDRP